MRETCASCTPESVLVYVHVPFCVRKCRYCAFVSQTYSVEAVQTYMALLEQEMAWWAGQYGRLRATTVYIGGGTPSLLTPAQVARLFDALERFFDLGQVREITLEANPESVMAPGFLDTARERGVSRISLGVQSFHDHALRMLGRPHDRQKALQAAHAVRTAGIAALSLDLMWGLPGQSLEMWHDDLQQAIFLEPEHLSCYCLSLEQGTELAGCVLDNTLTLPTEECAAQMFENGCLALDQAGYEQYEIANFAQPGHICQHNWGYWTGQSYLGLGPAAVSTMHGKRWANAFSLDAYAHALAAGILGKDAEELDAHTQLHEMVMLSLRTSAGLDLSHFQARAGWDFLHCTSSIVEQLCDSGLARICSNHFSLTREGMLVSNTILATVLECMDHYASAGNM